MSRSDEIEAIGEEHRRKMLRLQDEAEERQRRVSPLGMALLEAAERERAEAEEAARADAEAREAIARSIATRKANEVVTPVDDDEESAYYRRKSWLI